MTLIEHYLINYLHLPKENHVTHEIANFLESKGYSVSLQDMIKKQKEGSSLELRLKNGKNSAIIELPSEYQNSIEILEFLGHKNIVVSTLFYDQIGITGLRVTNFNKSLSILLNSTRPEVKLENIGSKNVCKSSIEYFLPELIDANLLLRAAHKEFGTSKAFIEKSKSKEMIKF